MRRLRCLSGREKADDQDLRFDRIDFELVTLLQTKAQSIEDLVTGIKTGNENDRLGRIRELLDAGKIKTDGKNYYL